MTEWEKLANRNDDLERELAETKAKLETAETKSDALQDVAWVSGATFGWNCAEAGNPKRLHDAICARQREYLPALATIRAGKDEEVMKADLIRREFIEGK